MSIHVVPRTNKKGVTSYYLRYYEGKSHKNVPRHLYPKFKSHAEAIAYIDSKNANGELLNHSRGVKALEWKNKFFNFNELLISYKNWQKKEAPNSYQSNVTYLTNYVYPYFLSERELSDVNSWHKHFKEYTDWLEQVTAPKTGKKLTYSTMNACIRTLNGFIKFLVQYNKIGALEGSIKCHGFKQSLVRQNVRTYKDVITESEFENLKKSLGLSKEFFIVLYNTGMRFNELYSLPVSAIHKGSDNIKDLIKKPFRTLGKTIYGYIYLESQIKNKTSYRDNKTGHIGRKPLKSKDKICHANSRTIPITDLETWEIIKKQHAKAKKDFQERVHLSSDPNDYLLFNIDVNKLRRDFSSKTKKSFHCARHSFTTFLVRDFVENGLSAEMAIRPITGHTSDAFHGYVHVVEEMNMKAVGNGVIEDL